MIFREHRKKHAGLADKLNYAYFVDEGIIVNKDGAFLTAFQYKGQDSSSSTGDALDSLTHMVNRFMLCLGDGWMIHVEPFRVESTRYPDGGYFPDAVSKLIDDERRAGYEAEGTHFENLHFLTFVWKFPAPIATVSKKWFLSGLDAKTEDMSLTPLLAIFKDKVRQCAQFLDSHLSLIPLSNSELLSYLSACLTGELLPFAVPPKGAYLDAALASKQLVGGFLPRIGNKKIYLISILNYLNSETMPGILEQVMTLPLVYRWSNRFMPLSEETAAVFLKRNRKNWHNKVKGIMGLVSEAITGRQTQKLDMDAMMMRDEGELTLTLNSSQSVRFGYWSSTLVIMHEDENVLETARENMEKYLGQRGFKIRLETINALDAYFGTLPGHGHANVRNLLVSSLNLAHFLPLHAIWAGEMGAHPSSLLPKDAPPVFYARTTGMTPYRYHMDIFDVGHQLYLGPPGAGKSTLLDLLIVQFLRYQNAQIFVFDKDHSHHALIEALGGAYYDVGNQDSLSFCPLAILDNEQEKLNAASYIESLVELQNIPLDAFMRADIFTAINAMSDEREEGNRTLTVFRSTVQNEQVRQAIGYYTLQGQFSLLDSHTDALGTAQVQGIEMGWLLAQNEAIYLPVLMHLFRQIERRFQQGQSAHINKPTLIILEEAWLYISHPVFAKKLRDWLKTLRKFNARIVFVTQSLADLIDPSTGKLTTVTNTILESCPVKVYLPNQDESPLIKNLYSAMGLNERQIEIITEESIPKKHYYVTSPIGNRLIDLGLEPHLAALKFLGLSKARAAKLLKCKKEYGEGWLPVWLEGAYEESQREEKHGAESESEKNYSVDGAVDEVSAPSHSHSSAFYGENP